MKTALGIWLALMASLAAGALEFKAPLQEIHTEPEATTVTADFEFTNKSGKDVTVKEYKPICDCISVMIKEGKLRYAPGESGLIRAKLNLQNLAGVSDKVIALRLDEDPEDKPSMSLTVRVHIPVLIEIEPKTLKWDLGGKCEPKTLRIRMNHSKPIHIKGVTSPSETFKYELKTIEDGKLYDLTVTPADVGNVRLAPFRIETDCDIRKYRIQQAFGAVQKPSSAQTLSKP